MRLTVDRWRTIELTEGRALLSGGHVEGDRIEPAHVEEFRPTAWRIAANAAPGLSIHDERGEVVGAVATLSDDGALTVRLAEPDRWQALAWSYVPRRQHRADDGTVTVEAARLVAVVALPELPAARCWSWHGLLATLHRTGLADDLRNVLDAEHERQRAAAAMPDLLADVAALLAEVDG